MLGFSFSLSLSEGTVMLTAYHAIRINEATLDRIANENGGVTPQIEEESTYYLRPFNPDHDSAILSEEDFRNKFFPVTEEHADQWFEVRRR
jgi:hypothetical protein